MRYVLPSDGDVRMVSEFALFPKTVGKEVRWFERVHYRKVYFYGFWYERPDRFLTKEEYDSYTT